MSEIVKEVARLTEAVENAKNELLNGWSKYDECKQFVSNWDNGGSDDASKNFDNLRNDLKSYIDKYI